jgi:Zn-dependent protease with chaperone function
MRAWLGTVVMLITCSTVVWARQTPSAEQPPSTGQQASTVTEAPVPVPEPSEKAMARYRSGVALWLIDTAWGIILPAAILLTGFSSRMRTWAARISRKRVLTIAIYFALFSIVTFVIDLPRAYYEEFVREHAYGLSNQTLSKWFGDSLKSLAVGVVMGALFLWVPYLLLKKSPRRWWLYTAMAAVPFLCLTLLIAPVWIDPLFNTFGPMKNKPLERKILQLADRAGIEGGRVYEVDKSTDTNALNAYVAGVGGTKRIVLWDTIIARLDEPQLLFVMGHEMGHYVLNHIWKELAIFSVMIAILLYAVHRLAGAVIARQQVRFGFTELSDVASLPLIMLLFSLAFFVVSPLALGITRHFEHEADRFGLEITRANRPAALSFVRLQEDNLANPRPHWLVRLFRASHPTLAERIEFANSYRPWETGQPLTYEHLFR